MYNTKKKGNILVGIGSNLRGHMAIPKKNLKIVFKYLNREGLRVRRFSKIYFTRPFPNGFGPSFCNCVVLIKTDLCGLDILKRLKKIEKIFGRRNELRNSPRVLDLDLLDCKGEVIKVDSRLIVPHPQIYKRNFVLFPISDVNPKWKDPNSYKNIKILLSDYIKRNVNNNRMNTISYLHV